MTFARDDAQEENDIEQALNDFFTGSPIAIRYVTADDYRSFDDGRLMTVLRPNELVAWLSEGTRKMKDRTPSDV